MDDAFKKVFDELMTLSPEEFRKRYEEARNKPITRIFEYILSLGENEND